MNLSPSKPRDFPIKPSPPVRDNVFLPTPCEEHAPPPPRAVPQSSRLPQSSRREPQPPQPGPTGRPAAAVAAPALDHSPRGPGVSGRCCRSWQRLHETPTVFSSPAKMEAAGRKKEGAATGRPGRGGPARHHGNAAPAGRPGGQRRPLPTAAAPPAAAGAGRRQGSGAVSAPDPAVVPPLSVCQSACLLGLGRESERRPGGGAVRACRAGKAVSAAQARPGPAPAHLTALKGPSHPFMVGF